MKSMHRTLFSDPPARGAEEAVGLLGGVSAIISMSSSHYRDQHPDHVALFNARVFNEAGDEVWSGDLDLTKKGADLQALADQIGPIAVTPEMPYCWEGLPDDFSAFRSSEAADACAGDWVFVFTPGDKRGLQRVAEKSRAITEARMEWEAERMIEWAKDLHRDLALVARFGADRPAEAK